MKPENVTPEMVEWVENAVGHRHAGWDCVGPREIIAAAMSILPSNESLLAALKECKQSAIDCGSMTEPTGYSDLDSRERTVADACWLKGMRDFETAVRNWAYDIAQKSEATKRQP